MKPIEFLTLAFLALGATIGRGAEDEPPFGIEKRVAWTSSRLVGSPEPPLPYTVEKTFSKITFKSPIFVADEPGTDRLLVVLQGGGDGNPARILRIADDPDTQEIESFLEVPRRLVYALCFHPDYESNGFIYLFTNGPTADAERTNRVSRLTVGRAPPRAVDPQSEKLILEWRSAGHDGGDLAFGQDRMLYITTGDGTADSDAWNSGQTLDDLLGSVLRIDVDHFAPALPYSIPRDNPFVDLQGARGEIWAYGLRNPWRMSIDPSTGQVWVGNNGQDRWETAHLVRRGENYGWSVYEGSHPFYLERRRGPTPHVAPTIEHSHAEFRSLTGGVVYHGQKLPDLDGAYIYGDYSTGRIWGMKHDGQRVVWHRELADTSLQIAAFRMDQRGELLVVDHGGGLYRLVTAPRQDSLPPFPRLLGETGLFASVAEHRVAEGVIPYAVNVAGWSDGARAERFIALPGDAQMGYEAGRSFTFPDGAALVQTLSMELEPGQAESRTRIETRVLLRQQGEWMGYTYRWNANQDDASLVERDGAEGLLALKPGSAATDGPRTWHYPSRTECMTCHSRAANFVLGITEAQLNRDHDYGAVRDNQLRALDHAGVFKPALPKPPAELARLAADDDAAQDLESRARAYLQVNCSVCHVSAGGGNSQMELLATIPREKMNIVGARPQHDTFGISNAMLVAPGNPDGSVLAHRMARRGSGQMPPLGTARVDERAIKLVRDWIAGMKSDKTIVRRWQMDDLLPVLEQLSSGRSLPAGQTAFRETGCVQCHRFAGEGGNVGPDLTGVGKRVAANVLLESILLPSKVIAEEYATHAFETDDGRVVTGRIEREDDRSVVVRLVSETEPVREIAKDQIVERRRLDRSNMPAGIVDVLQKEQVLDLLAYLLADPKPQATSP